MKRYRVKAFVFVNARDEKEAESLVETYIGASQRPMGRGVIDQALVRPRSAKPAPRKNSRGNNDAVAV